MSIFPKLVLCVVLIACQSKANTNKEVVEVKKTSIENCCTYKPGKTISNRFVLPEGYSRTLEEVNSFAHYLRSLPLKPDGSLVQTYNGQIKPNNGIYEAVADIDIGKRDLQQCADAIMRLRAEHLYKQHKIDKIGFI